MIKKLLQSAFLVIYVGLFGILVVQFFIDLARIEPHGWPKEYGSLGVPADTVRLELFFLVGAAVVSIMILRLQQLKAFHRLLGLTVAIVAFMFYATENLPLTTIQAALGMMIAFMALFVGMMVSVSASAEARRQLPTVTHLRQQRVVIREEDLD